MTNPGIKLFDRKTTVLFIMIIIMLAGMKFWHLSSLKENYSGYGKLLPGTDMVTNHREAIKHRDGTFPDSMYHRVFAYSYMVAGIYSFLPENSDISALMEAVYYFQCVLGILASVATGYAAYCFFGKTAGFLALLISGLSSSGLVFETELLEAAPARAAIAISLALASHSLMVKVRFDKFAFKNYKTLMFSGMVFGIAALLRPNLMLAIPFLSLAASWLIWRRYHSWKAAFSILIAMSLSSFITFMPPIIRNSVVEGRPAGLISTSGSSLWIGNNSGATGRLMIDRDLMDDLEKEGREPDVREVLLFMRKKPLEYLTLQLRKGMLLFAAAESPNNVDPELISEYSLPVRFGIGFGFITPMFLCFLIMAGRGTDKVKSDLNEKIVFLTLISGGLIFSTVLFFVISRFRVPLLPPLEIMAAGAMVNIPSILFHGKNMERFLVIAALLTGLATAYFFPALSRFHQFMTPSGTIEKTDGEYRIIDDSGVWSGGEVLKISEGITAVKDIVLPELSLFSSAALEIAMIADNAPDHISVFTGNGNQKAELDVASLGRRLAGARAVNARYKLPIELLNSGVNSIGIRFPATVDIPVDRTYDRGRSKVLFSKPGNGSAGISQLKGEMMIRLVLIP